jgi:formate dehydrogenase major subunit
MGRGKQTEQVKSTCSQCSLGCGIEIFTRGGNVLRLEADWDAPVNGGRLCQRGRFEPLDEQRTRVTRPMVKRNGRLEPASWEEAIQSIASHLGGIPAQEIGVLTSSGLTNEALYLLGKLFRQEFRVVNVGLLNKVAPKFSDKTQGSLADIPKSDVILVVGADPVKDQPVASFLIKRSMDKGARLIVVDGKDNGLAPFAHQKLEPSDTSKALELVERAVHPVVLYGAGVTEKVEAALKKLSPKAVVLPLEPGVNSRAARVFGFDNGYKPAPAKFLYLLPGEEKWDGQEVLKKAGEKAFIVLQASFVSPLMSKADVVLPMAIWSERSGTLTNTEGRVQKTNPAVKPMEEAKPDWEILSLLANKLGKKLGTSLAEISARATQELN